MKYTHEEAKRLREVAVSYPLSGVEMLANPDDIVRDCNGVGADWMPDSLTQIITRLAPIMEIPAAIHDRRYATGTTRQDRLDADTEFLSNVLKVNEATYAWWHPLRYINRKRAERYYTYLRAFGGRAWEEARERYGK